jgi:hypothetical protein
MRRRLAGAVALAMLLAACGSSAGSTEANPTPNASPTGVTGDTGVTVNGSSSVPPSGPAGTTGVLNSGAASITITGDVSESTSLDRLSGLVAYAPPPDAFFVGWTDAGGDQVLTMAGQTFTGTRQTSDALMLSLHVVDDAGAHTFSSTAGECSVEVAEAAATSLSGSVSCVGLKGERGVTVGVVGTFEATG